MPNRNKKIGGTAKYTVPVDEKSDAGAKRMNKRGKLRRGFKYTDNSGTDGRIPLASIAKAPKLSRRRRMVGFINSAGMGKNKVKY